KKVTPAGVLYFHVHNPLLSTKNGINRDEALELMLKRYKMKGLLTADPIVVRKMDTELDTGYSKIVPAAIKKDDSFYSNASVVSNMQWEILRKSLRNKIKHVGEQIQEGCVAIEPYQQGDRSPCQFCDFKAVCKFDPSLGENQY